MKKNKVLLGFASVFALLLLIPALIVPSMGQAQSAPLAYYNMTGLSGLSYSQLKSQLGGTENYPSSATVVADPDGSGDEVLKLDSKTALLESTGECCGDYSTTYWITWNDGTKTSGTAIKDGTSTVYTVTSTDGGKNVTFNNKSYKVYANGFLKEATLGGANVDRNMTVGNPALAYNAYNKVILQADYYVPSGGKGMFEGQIKNFSFVKNDTTYNASWLNMLRINLDSGVLDTGHAVNADGAKGSIVLEKDAWNTVSLVIDLDSGAVVYYVNNVKTFEGVFSFGYNFTTQKMDTNAAKISPENITLKAGQWIVAKLNKNTSATTSSDYAGNLYIDNILCQECTTGMEMDLSKQDVLYVDMTLLSGRRVGTSGEILVNYGVEHQTTKLSAYADAIAPVKGASIRLSNATGVRFATQVNANKIDELVAAKAEGKIRNVQIGTLITPYAYVTEAGAFTVDALSKLSYSAKYLDVKATIGEYYNPGVTLDEGYNTCFVGSIIDIRPGNRARLFTAVGYIKVTLNNGAVKYIYSYDYTDATTQEQNYARSIQYIASVFVNDSRFEAYREVLQSFMDGLTAATGYSETYVNNVQYSYNEFYFQNAAGVACQLVYDGNNGWRLQAVKPTQTNSKYNEFNNIGAAQALANYLGEAPDDKAMKLTVSQDAYKFTVRAEGTDSYVTLNITGGFNLRFFSPDGVLMNNVNSISADGTNVTMRGALNNGEAVYGGGETFTAANKRGQYMSLYAYDAYNSGNPNGNNLNGTYTVIPLFTFTRGSGMFINRYETMTADWGNTSNGSTSSNVWEISIENDLIDCYFYATGNMLDAIYGYTDLSGHATLPEEWAQGTLICRYSPDFTSLDGETMVYQKVTEIPDYTSLKKKHGSVYSAITSTTTFAARDLVCNGTTPKYIYADYDFDGDCEFVRVTKKAGAPMGAGVKAIIENLIAAGMKPTAMVLEGLGWGNLGTAAGYENFVDVINYCEENDINTTLYMSVGDLNAGMPGYKEEYQLKANIHYDVLIESGGYDSAGYQYTHSYTTGLKENVISMPSAASANPDTGKSNVFKDYLDITNPEAVEWYMDVVWGQLIELGVDGCKIDFCELMPNEGSTVAISITGTNSAGKTKDYGCVDATIVDYLWYDDAVFEGDDVHHAYSSYFISLFCQRMLEKAPEGFVVLNRGGGIGMQRNPYMWAGDQSREEITLTTQLMAVLNSGISGLPFMTYDMAGYAYSKTADGPYDYWNGSWDKAGAEEAKAIESEIFARAIQYTAFSLMIQTHGDVRHMYDLSEEAQAIAVQYTKLHDDLIPYIQKYSKIACDTGMPVLRLLVLHYQNDANVYNISDQYMFGDGLMVAPILTLDTTTRSVYLPEGTWVDLLTGEEYVITQDTPVEERWITVTAQINQIPVFLNADSEDAEYLSGLFNGKTWQAINGGVKIPSFTADLEGTTPDDPMGGDIFHK